MSNRSLPPDSWDSRTANIFASPAPFLALWNPILIGLTQFNGRTIEGVGTLFCEWQNFIGHRLTQDMQLMQLLATCKSPDQIAAVYAAFWQKAFADYTKEFTTLNNLLTGITGKAISHTHSASEEAAKTSDPSRVAA